MRKEIINEEKANNKKQRVTYDAQRVIAKKFGTRCLFRFWVKSLYKL